MKTIDEYHRWVEWSDEDQAYIGKCPDLLSTALRMSLVPARLSAVSFQSDGVH